MDEKLFDDTKLVSYFLWQETKHDNTLKLWYCAENIACWLEGNRILTKEDIHNIMGINKEDFRYINFVRVIAYMIYIHTNNNDKSFNWFVAEKLLQNNEWVTALICMAKSYNYNKTKKTPEFSNSIKSDIVKKYYYYPFENF